PKRSETENLTKLTSEIEAERIDFAFVYWPELDCMLHLSGNDAPEPRKKLLNYEKWIEELLAKARAHYEEVRLFIFSDHGMANCDELVDLKSQIAALNLKMGMDYAVVYDSTMARFWFFNQRARDAITEQLRRVPQGRILPDAQPEE